MRVSTAEFISGFEGLADRAETEPVTITQEGRDRLVLVSADEYARLKGADDGSSGMARASRPEASRLEHADLVEFQGGMPDPWGALRGTTSSDKDSDITEPTGNVWEAER